MSHIMATSQPPPAHNNGVEGRFLIRKHNNFFVIRFCFVEYFFTEDPSSNQKIKSQNSNFSQNCRITSSTLGNRIKTLASRIWTLSAVPVLLKTFGLTIKILTCQPSSQPKQSGLQSYTLYHYTGRTQLCSFDKSWTFHNTFRRVIVNALIDHLYVCDGADVIYGTSYRKW